MTEPLISVAAAARERGITRQALGRHVRTGAVRSHVTADGHRMVRMSEVAADLAANVDSSLRPATGPAARRTEQAAGEARVRVSDVVAHLAWATETALATEAGEVDLEHLGGLTVSRADAQKLLTIYRAGNVGRIRQAHELLRVRLS
jgi:hypothetical protein